MTEHLVTLPNGACFTAQHDENLLVAAQRANWLVRYGCRNGNCEACAATLLKGRVTQTTTANEVGQVIDANAAGEKILLCLCHAESDLQIELPGDSQHGSREQARRYYARINSYARVNHCAAVNDGVRVDDDTRVDDHSANITTDDWQLNITLPAGRVLPIYPGQYVLLEYRDALLRAEIDTAQSSGREWHLRTRHALTLSDGNYIAVHGPLGFCYVATPPTAMLIVHDDEQIEQALLLKSALPHAQLIAATQLAQLSSATAFDAVLACTLDPSTVSTWYNQLLQQRVAFTEFRSDHAICYRWRVLHQDDHGSTFVIDEGLSENAARSIADDFIQRGHKQLYWAEPILSRNPDHPL